jgi:hypothetical protein
MPKENEPKERALFLRCFSMGFLSKSIENRPLKHSLAAFVLAHGF